MEPKHESDNDGAMKSKANIALIVFLIIAMFPILVFMDGHLARCEEQNARTEFGDAYTRYEANTPAFFPYGVKAQA